MRTRLVLALAAIAGGAFLPPAHADTCSIIYVHGFIAVQICFRDVCINPWPPPDICIPGGGQT